MTTINNYWITEALLSLAPNSEFVVRGDLYSGIEWLDQSVLQPSESDVVAEIEKLQGQVPLKKCKEQAKIRISKTDWSMLSDVNISNKADFETYRATLRDLIVNPVADPVWPTEPQPVWV